MYLFTNKLRTMITKYVNIKIDYTIANDNILDQLDTYSKDHKGSHSTVLHLMTARGKIQKILSHELKLPIDDKSLVELRKISGNSNVWLSI